MSDFSLRQLVHDVMGATAMSDPGDIADEVAWRIDDADLRAALNQALRGFVREEITRLRAHNARRGEATPAGAQPALADVPEVVSSPGRRALKVPGQPGRSAKVAGIRDWWSAELRKPFHVGEKRWLALGDCGFDELMYAAAERRNHATRNAARAESLTGLASELAAAGVARVRDLPIEVLRAYLGGVAA
jgi:hypothetical protein